MRCCLLLVCCLWTSGLVAGENASLEAARDHWQQGRYAEALEVYEQITPGQGRAAKIALGISRAYEAQGKWNEAAEAVEDALENSPKNPDLLARLSDLEFRRGRYEQAEKMAETALEEDGRQLRARMVIADVYTETGRIAKANRAYRWFVRYYNRTQPSDADSLLWVARGALQYARWNSVSQIFDFVVNTLCPDALQADEHAWQAHFIAGSLLLEKYNRAQALPELRKALTINPRAADVLAALGQAALQTQEFAKARQFAERARRINPRHLAALRLQSDIALKKGQFKEALKVLQKARDVNPHDQRTLARMAACYLLQDGSPQAARLKKLLGNLNTVEEVSAENPSRFAKLLIALVKRNSKPGYFLHRVGKILEQHRRYGLAEPLYKQAVRNMPQLSPPQTALGFLYMRTGRLEEARRKLDAAFEADPYHVRLSNTRKVLEVLESYQTLETEHFLIRFDPAKDGLLAESMADYLEETYDELTARFGFEPEQRTQVEIYNEAKGLSGHQWFSARMVGLPWIQTVGASTGYIIALASPTASEKPFNWARVLRHELVHIVTLQQTDFHIPHWFTEALAVLSEGYPRPSSWNELLLERVPRGKLRTLENLSEGFIAAESPADWQFAYCQSRLYAEYMIENHGRESLQQLLAAYGKNRSTGEALESVFGVDRATFEAGYREYLQKIVAELQGRRRSSPEESLAQREKAYRDDPENPTAAARYAFGLFEAGRFQQARRLADMALKQNEAEPLAAVVKARLELRGGDASAAEKTLKPALNRQQPHPLVLKLLARTAQETQDFSKALQFYRLGCEHFPDDLPWLRGQATAAAQLGNKEVLQESLRELARRDADDVTSRRKLAQLALEEGDYQAARRYALKALHIEIRDADVHRLLAAAFAGMEQYADGIEEYQTALQLDPEKTTWRLELARLCLKAGRDEQAKRHAERILAEEPQNAEAKHILSELQE